MTSSSPRKKSGGRHSHRSNRGHRKRNREPRPHGPKREHVEELHPTADPPEVKSFDEWDLGPEIQTAIRNMDIRVPTPIQALSIGAVLAGKDVIAKAETGTGKTLAFGAPMMSRIDPARATVLGMVLCPTRELAQQVCQVVAALGFPRGVRVALVVGGDPIHPQIADLQAGAQVLVGTPGRVLDLYQQGFLRFPWTEYVVLDEADKMFEIGFLDDIKKILSLMPEERQTLLFSATFPTEVLKLARAETRDPVEVATARGTVTVDSIDQFYMEMGDEDRPLALTRLLERSGPDDVFLVFCDRRTEVDRLLRRMERLPFGVKALHGGYDQASRFRVMSAFRTGEVKALLATDVASRGLDVEHVSHVINFSVPREIEDYAHRVGRTGRAGRSGTAITFVTPAEKRRWRSIESHAKWDIEEIEPPGSGGRRGRDGDASERGPRRPAREREEKDERGERAREGSEGGGRGRREERPRDERPREDRPRGRRRSEEPREDRPRRGRSERTSGDERNSGEGDERPRRREREGARTREAGPAAGETPFKTLPVPDAPADEPGSERPRERRPRRSRDQDPAGSRAPEAGAERRPRRRPRSRDDDGEPRGTKASDGPPGFGSGL